MCLEFLFTALSVVFCLLGAIVGVFLVQNPRQAIELQTRFYALINWRLEPISLPKEIQNTRLMGLFLIIAVTVVLLYLVLRR